jgi:uncharacterized protein (TIGR03435 family)
MSFRRALTILAAGAAVLSAQTPAPAFEVASVKPVNMSLAQAIQSRRVSVHIDDAMVDLQALPLINVFQQAYGVPPGQIRNAPEWMSTALFDIRATLPAGASSKQVPEMLQSLLVERFRLAAHHQAEIRPVYELTAGSKRNLKRTEDSSRDDTKMGLEKCRVESGHRVCRNMTMTELAAILSGLASQAAVLNSAPLNSTGDIETDYLVDRPVVDMTGIGGSFDFTLDYGRIAMGGRGRAGEPGTFTQPPLVRVRDSIAALGLKLESAKRPFDVIVIDHVERSVTPN